MRIPPWPGSRVALKIRLEMPGAARYACAVICNSTWMALFSGLVSFGGSNGDWGFVDNQRNETGDGLHSGSCDSGP